MTDRFLIIPKGKALPCPFCGNSELALEEGGSSYHDEDHGESWIVLCKCGVKSPHQFYSQEQAIAFWNKRAPVFVVKTEDFDSESTWAIMSDKEEAEKYALEALQCEPFTQRPSDEVRVYECNVNCKGLEFSQEEIFFQRSQEAVKRNNQLFGIANE